jgi:hypothetical protein
MRRSRVSHQNRSRPRNRWGSIGWVVAMDGSMVRVAASSSAIWKPELPPPTTSTGPSGRAWVRLVARAFSRTGRSKAAI